MEALIMKTIYLTNEEGTASKICSHALKQRGQPVRDSLMPALCIPSLRFTCSVLGPSFFEDVAILLHHFFKLSLDLPILSISHRS